MTPWAAVTLIALRWSALCSTAPTYVIEHVDVEVGDGSLIQNISVVLANGRVASMGALPTLPEEATRVDGRGKVLTPGFIETVSQLGLTEIGREKTTDDSRLRDANLTPAFPAIDGLNRLSPHIAVSREEGITSAITSPQGGVLYGMGAWFELTRHIPTETEPAPPAALYGGVDADAAAAAGGARGGAWLRLREAFADARYWRQRRNDVDQGAARVLSLGIVHQQALQPVLDRQVPLVLRAQRAADILAALRLAHDEGVRLIIADGAEAHLVADALAAARYLERHDEEHTETTAVVPVDNPPHPGSGQPTSSDDNETSR